MYLNETEIKEGQMETKEGRIEIEEIETMEKEDSYLDTSLERNLFRGKRCYIVITNYKI